LEKGSAYAARGQMLPPFDTRETLGRLEREVAATAPRLLILLGDSFHDRGAEGRLGADETARIGALALGRTLIWITGNHDADGPGGLPGEVVESLTLAGLSLVHEPRAGLARGEVAGHLHPCAKVRGGGGAVRRRCFVSDGERLVLPAFGALAGGLNVRDAAFRPLFARHPLAGVLGRGRVHAISWAALEND
jgi:DNA ligase-associated metallophosphoesterase